MRTSLPAVSSRPFRPLRPLWTAGVALLCVAALGGGCKKKAPEGLGGGTTGPDVGSVEQAMQVVSVSPGTVAPGVSSSVQVLGSGFVAGAMVQVGPQRVPSAQVLNANVMAAAVPPLAAGTYDVTVTLPTGDSSTLRGGLRVVAQGVGVSIDRQRCGSVTVYFDTDQAGLSPTARSRLDGVMDCYTAGGHTIQLTGHADVRGTTDYNVALGQRRAEAVRDHLMRAGVAPQRLPITSYGEEQPADRASGEASWAKNRRVELVIP